MVKLEKEKILNAYGFHIGETILKGDQATFRHTHDFYELFIIKEGEVCHYINEKQFLLKTDTLWLVKPEDEHYFRKGKCKKAQFVNLAFSKEVFAFAKEIYGIYSDHKYEEEEVSVHMPMNMEVSVLSKISYLAREKSNLVPVDKKNTLISILLDCFMVLGNQADYKGEVPVWLENACLEMQKEENYLEGLPRFVKLAGKSKEHLMRCMRKYYHTTPAEYINSIRLEQVAVLLETTEDSVLDIMLECGFNNVSYFNRLFKKAYGTTPSRYRLINRSVINPG